MTDLFRFDGFVLHAGARTLVRDGERVAIGPRAFDVLLALLDRAGHLVTKTELLDRAWPGLVVEESNVQVQISGLRKILGAEALATIPGLGYRLTRNVERDGSLGPGRPVTAPLSSSAIEPSPAAALFGREQVVQALSSAVRAERVISVVGAGGIGKTRVAREVARAVARDFGPRSCWVDLSSLSAAEHLDAAIAVAAGVQLGESNGSAGAALAAAFGDQRALVVLDNCEHLAGGVGPIVHALATLTAGVHILMTSQKLVGIAGEQVHRLEPLALPPPGASPADVPGFSAAQLLVQRVRAIDRRFAISVENAGAVVELLGRLDGLPLAIEMAAAWIPKLGPRVLGGRLSDWLELLRGPAHGAPPRQQTLRATLEWSHSLLTAAEQVVLRRLSPVLGAFRIEVACAVAGDVDLDECGVLDALSGLVDKSLVQLESAEPPRYRLLETTRMYALERLAASDERDVVMQRRQGAAAALGDEVESRYWELSDAAWLGHYGPEYAELQAVFDAACASGQADAAARIGAALQRMDHLRSINAARKRRAEILFGLLERASVHGRALIWMCVTSHNMIPLDVVTRLEASREAVASWRLLNAPARLHFALGFHANECARGGDFGRAEAALAEARALERPDWPVRRRMWAASARAGVCIHRGDAQGYRQHCRTELAIAEGAGAERTVATARLKLADAALMAGDLDESVELGRAAVRTLRDLDQPSNLGLALSNLCSALLLSGQRAEAIRAAREALPLLWRNGWGHLLLDALALDAAQCGHALDAAVMLGYTEQWYRAHQDVRQPNEARLAAMAAAEVTRALGVEAFDSACGRGSALHHEDAEALAAAHVSRATA